MNRTGCKSCWWQEGGMCYSDDAERDEKGWSLIPAEKVCDEFWDKRKALSSLIPNDKLVITSEGRNGCG